MSNLLTKPNSPSTLTALTSRQLTLIAVINAHKNSNPRISNRAFKRYFFRYGAILPHESHERLTFHASPELAAYYTNAFFALR